MPDAITAEGLGKVYRLGERAGLRTRTRGELWALRDLSFSVGEGDVVGVVGRNGAGKSTLLKILSRITEPSEGRARVRGRVGALLEVGTAFHPELTGRENIYINGAILGMPRSETRRKFDEIVEFAGIERFLDTPLKRYSSGMSMRLGFAVAAHLEPDVIVIDEVLAVGDAEFQRKCLGRMGELGREGRTVLFVSHDLGAIGQLCARALWIDGGRLREDGPADRVIRDYLRQSVPATGDVRLPSRADAPAEVTSVRVTGESGEAGGPIHRGEPLTLSARLVVREPTPGLEIAFSITGSSGVRIVDEAWLDAARDPAALGREGERSVELVLPPLLPAGEYTVGLWLGNAYDVLLEEEVLQLEVLPRSGDPDEAVRRRRAVQPAVEWRVR